MTPTTEAQAMPDTIWVTDKTVDGYIEEWFPFEVKGAEEYLKKSTITAQLKAADDLVGALQVLATFPITENSNIDAINMQKIAREVRASYASVRKESK